MKNLNAKIAHVIVAVRRQVFAPAKNGIVHVNVASQIIDLRGGAPNGASFVNEKNIQN